MQKTIRFLSMVTIGAVQWGLMILHLMSTPMAGMGRLRGMPIATPLYRSEVPSTMLLAGIIEGHQWNEGPNWNADTAVWAMVVAFPRRRGVSVLKTRMGVLTTVL